MLQRLWELKVDWDDPLPMEIREVWLRWRSELKCLSEQHIPRCYFPKEAHIVAVDLHGFSDASECAYAGVVYLRMIDSDGRIHISIVTSKTKVAPIKRLTIPRLDFITWRTPLVYLSMVSMPGLTVISSSWNHVDGADNPETAHPEDFYPQSCWDMSCVGMARSG